MAAGQEPSARDRPVRLAILVYHSVSPRRPGRSFRRYTVSPRQFQEHLAVLAEHGLRGTSVRRLLRPTERRDGRTLVGVSFDDAFADVAEHAVPELQAAGMTATVYVPTAYVGRNAEWLSSVGESERPLLSWAALADLADSGIECGSHGHEHLALDTLPAQRAEHDVRTSRDELGRHLGAAPVSFAFPYGYYDRRAVEVVRGLGFQAACGVGYATNAEDRVDRFRLQRIQVGHDMAPEALLDALTRRRRSPSGAARFYTRPLWRAVRALGGTDA